MTSYLFITPKANYDENGRKAIDPDLVTRKTIVWGTKVDVIENTDHLTAKDPSLLNGIDQIDIQHFNKDTHNIIIDSEEYKVVNMVSKPDSTDNNGPKPLTMDIVKKVAEELMKKNGSTTSLDVKNELRMQGYWAKQQQVGDFMRALHTQYAEWDSMNNGQFNTYMLNEDPDDADDDSGTATLTAPTSTRTVRTPAAQVSPALNLQYQTDTDNNVTRSNAVEAIENAIKNHQLQVTGFINTDDLWVAYCPETKQVALYEDGLNSDSVRNAFRKLIGKRIQKVRACRYKNIDHWTL